MMRLERESHAAASEFTDAAWGGIDPVASSEECRAADFTAEQAAVAQALAEPRALALLEGRAGTSKTRALAPFVVRLRSESYCVIAAAPA